MAEAQAKPEFDPSQPFTTTASSSGGKPAFDENKPFTKSSDDTLAQKAAKGVQKWGSWILGLTPAAGAIAGGIAAAPETLGFGSALGAGAGYAAGKQIERLGRKYLLNENVPNSDYGDILGDTATGTMADLGGQVTGSALSNMLRKVGIGSAVQHLRPTPQVANALGPEKLDEIATQALENGDIQPFQKVASTAQNLAKTKAQAGQKIGEIISKSDAMVNPADIAQNIQENIITPLQETNAGKKIAAPIQEKLDSLMEHLGNEPVPVSQIEAEKTAEQAATNYRAPEPAAKIKADRAFSGALRQASEDALQNQDAERLQDFLDAKTQFGNAEAARKMANRTASLTDHGAGLIGRLGDMTSWAVGMPAAATLAASGHYPAAAAAASTPILRALTKGRVASTVGTGAYGLANLLEAAPGNAISRAMAAYLASKATSKKEE